MARIRSLSLSPLAPRVHPTEVDAEWSVVHAPAGAFLQISTFGSDNRVSAPKVSQTLQVDRAIAKQLKAALEQTFPGI